MSDSLSKMVKEVLVTQEAQFANKALDYFDGKQLKHVEDALSDSQYGRKRWRERGMRAISRNITGMVVEKSGLLFNGQEPLAQVFLNDDKEFNEEQTEKVLTLLEQTDWVEFFNNFDHVVRLLKTGLVLVQYNEKKNSLVFDVLHRANAGVILNGNHEVEVLIHRTGDNRLRMWTAEEVTELEERENDIVIIGKEDNPYGEIPIVSFYDTHTPRTGFWVEAPTDLVIMNEIFNVHLVDTEFAASWAKLQTLFTNCEIKSSGYENLEISQKGTDKLPSLGLADAGLVGGPNRIVQLDTQGVDSPFVEYKGPEVNLKPIDDMMNGWIRDFAMDWSVRIKSSGDASARSGFQLVVEEVGNLELRAKRSRMFEAGFKRLYESMKLVYNYHNPGHLSDEGKLIINFPIPKLPVDVKNQEEIWSIRIAEGRATIIDYLIEEKGMTPKEAELKLAEIKKVNATNTGTDEGEGNSLRNITD